MLIITDGYKEGMRWFVFMVSGKVHSFSTKEKAQRFANIVGKERVRSIYCGW